MPRLKTAIAALSLLLAQAALSVTQQPLPQTAPVGDAATFTAQASAACSFVVFKNGVEVAENLLTDANGNASYTTPAVVAADNGKQFAFRFFNCKGVAGAVSTNQATLTVSGFTTVPLQVTGSIAFEDGTPVAPNTTVQIFEGTLPIGQAASDGVGSLSGNATLDPKQALAGNVSLSAGLAGLPGPGTVQIPINSFLHGSTGIAFHLVVWKADFLAWVKCMSGATPASCTAPGIKSVAIALTP